MATVWQKLKEYRLSRKLSQADFAKLYLGSSDRGPQGVIHNLEKGLSKKFPSELLLKIANDIGTSVDNICNESLESIFDKPVKTDFSSLEPMLNNVLNHLTTLQLEVNKLRNEIEHLKRQ